MTGAVVAVASAVNYQTNHTRVYAVNDDYTFFGVLDPHLTPTAAWAQLPTVPGASVVKGLSAVYNPQLNQIVVSVVCTDNTAYVIVNPDSGTTAWQAITGVPTT